MMSILRTLTGILFFTLLIPSPAVAADWPQWRGANRDGLCTETGLLQSWPAAGPPLAWKAKGLGKGFSGVAVVGNRIYTMGDRDDASYVLALDLAHGKTIWATRVGAAGGGGGHPGPRCTPTIDGNLGYALNQYGDLICVDLVTGKAQWHKNLKRDFGGKMMSGWGYSESPLVDGDKLLCTPGGSRGTLVALNKKTGELIWQSQEFTDNAAYSSLIVEELGGVRQYIQLTDASVAGVAAQDGRLLWKAPRKGRTAVVTTPIFHAGQVFVTSAYGVGCNLFKVTASSPFKAEEVYKNKNMANHHGGVILFDNHLYGYSDGKGWVCQDFQTGEIVWRDKSLGKGSILYADHRFYLRSESSTRGTLALIEATPAGYHEQGRFNQPDLSGKRTWPHPVIAYGKLFIRDQDLLLCYDVRQK